MGVVEPETGVPIGPVCCGPNEGDPGAWMMECRFGGGGGVTTPCVEDVVRIERPGVVGVWIGFVDWMKAEWSGLVDVKTIGERR